MKLFKSKKRRILVVAIIVVAVVAALAIWNGSVSRTDGTPLLSTNVIDLGIVNVGDPHDYYPYRGALYTYTESDNNVVIKCRSQSGTKTVAKVDEIYAGDYIAVIDENHLILRRDKTLVVYDIQDKTEHILTEPEKYYFDGEDPIACRSDGVYFTRKIEQENVSADDEEANTVYSVFRYSPLTGIEEEIHRYSGEDLSMTSEGIWYEAEGKIIFFSFDDQKTTTLDAIDWPDRGESYFLAETKFLCSANYIVRVTSGGVDVYNVKSGETKEIFAGSFMQMCAFITDKVLCFSQWEVDMKFWPLNEEADGTYKYTFETGVLEKISDDDCRYFAVLDERTLLVETNFGFLKKIKLLG